MRIGRAWGVCLGLALLSTLMCAGGADAGTQGVHLEPAGDPIEQTSAAIIDRQPTAVAVRGAGGETLGSWSPTRWPRGGGPVRTITCGYFPLGGVEGTYNYGVDQVNPVNPEEQRPYFFICDDADGVQVSMELIVYDPADPFNGVLATDRAIDRALASLELAEPQVQLSPPVDADHLVGLATWVSHGGTWEPVEATATIDSVSATVSAAPRSMEVDPGDGSPRVHCQGAGRPYQSGLSDDLGCTHTWVHRSTVDDPQGSYPLSVSIEWEITWAGSTGGGGLLGTLTTDTVIPVRVQEAQALIRY